VVGNIAAAIGLDDGDSVRHGRERCTLAHCVYRSVLEKPELVGSCIIPVEGKGAHRLPGRRVFDAPESTEGDFGL
jgi:hypothetical protein